jgi:hypothetical protein
MNDLPHIDSPISEAERTRRDYKQARARRLALQRQNEMAAPRVEGIADPSDGTLFRHAADDDLKVWIEKEDNFFPDDTLTLEINDGTGFVSIGSTFTIESNTSYPVLITLKERVPEGSYSLRYKHQPDNQPNYSLPTPLRVDRTSPWGSDNPPKALIDTEQVTDAYLAANPSGIKIVLDDYIDQKENDVAYLWFASDIEDLGDPHIVADVPADRTFLVEADTVRAWKDGLLYVVYRLRDIAGNESKDSIFHALSIALGALPVNLAAPVVPLAADGLLDLEDARAGVMVEIPKFDNPKNTDSLAVTWGGTALMPQPIATRQPPYEVQVPSSVLRGEYGNATGAVPLEVSYKVVRGVEPFGPESDTIQVDFSVVGPVRPDPDPDWPDPINNALAPCEVRGPTSGELNKLTRADNQQAAKLTFTKYDNIKDDEIVRFYWNDVPVPEADYTVDTNKPEPWEVDIPWAYIEQAGNTSALPVQYGIWDKDLTNEQRSPATSVEVDAVIIVAPQPAFEGLSPRGSLNCDSLLDPSNPTAEASFRVSVPDLTSFGLKAGEKVTMVWTPYQEETGGTPIPNATLKATIELGTEYPVTGFVWHVKPYKDHILPIYVLNVQYGRGEVNYSFELANGETVDSEPLSAKVTLGLGGGSSCPI